MRYGNFTFGDQTTQSPSIQLRTSVVDSRDAASAVQYDVEVHWLEDDLADANAVDALRVALTQPGLPLVMDAAGLANLDVQTGGRHPPLSPVEVIGFDAQPVAGLDVWEIRWRCRFQLAAAAVATWQRRVTWQETIRIDERGRTSRIIAGTLQVAAGESADAFKSQVRVPVPAGFRRVKSEWITGDDCRSLSFEMVDAELAAALPAGIVSAEMQVTWSSEIAAKASQIDGKGLLLRGQVETAANVRPGHAGKVLCQIASTAIRKLARGSVTAVPVRWETQVDLFSRRTQIDWQFALAGSATHWLVQSGLWELDVGDDAAWRRSLEPLWQPEGFAQLRSLQATSGNTTNAPDSAVIALHQFNAATGSTVGSTSSVIGSAATLSPNLSPSLFSQLRSRPGVYLAYDVSVRFQRRENVVVHQPAITVAQQAAGANSLGSRFTASASPIRESVGRPTQTITLTGRAVRWGAVPVLPTLLHVGGREVWEVSREETVSSIGPFGDLPAKQVAFEITYEAADYLGDRSGLQV